MKFQKMYVGFPYRDCVICSKRILAGDIYHRDENEFYHFTCLEKRASDYQIENPPIQKLLKDIGNMLAAQMPPGYGMMFMIYSYGEGGDLFYISSAMREDMLKMLKEFISKQDKLG